jgi:hypothetical protein
MAHTLSFKKVTYHRRFGSSFDGFILVYRQRCGNDHYFLSGLGLFTNKLVPVDSKVRYDDANLIQAELRPVSFTAVVDEPPCKRLSRLGEEWLIGFPLHDACWTILFEAVNPDPDDIQRLADLFRSCPMKGYGVWQLGHEYGGVNPYYQNPELLFPGEDRSFASYPDPDSVVRTAVRCDPIKLLDLDWLQQVGLQQFPKDESDLLMARSGYNDPFEKFPAEIICLILCQLPSRDVLSLKLASPVVSCTRLPGSFWKSRFYEGFECHYIFESRHQPQPDWRSLYFGISHIQHDQGLINRRRIWNLAMYIKGLLSQMSSLEGRPILSLTDSGSTTADSSWGFVTSRIPKGRFDGGSKVLWTRALNLTFACTRVYVSLITFAGLHYVSGISFQSKEMEQALIGYIHSRQVCIDLSSLGGCLAGFHVTFDSHGIRGLAAVSTVGKISSWAGCHESLPMKTLYSAATQLTELKIGVDVC